MSSFGNRTRLVRLLRAATPLSIPFAVLACQPLPHPFEDNRPPAASPLLSPPDAVGIVVRPIVGAPGPASAALTGAMAEALRKEGVPADTTAWNGRSYRLTGAVVAQTHNTFAHLTFDWVLISATGDIVARQVVAAEVSDVPWREGDRNLANALVARPAPLLAHSLWGDTPIEHIAKPEIVSIAPVLCSSGDGGHALSTAIVTVLRQAGVALQSNPEEAPTYKLTGKVDINRAGDRVQNVRVVWILSHLDGREIGRVSQENSIQMGSLDGRWGDTAYDIAVAATPSILELIKRGGTPTL